MRDLVAGARRAALLLVVAASLATTLQMLPAAAAARARLRARARPHDHRRDSRRRRPVLFSEDAARFYYGERSIDKDLIAAVRVLINGVADRRRTCRAGTRERPARQATSFEDRPGRHRARSVGRRASRRSTGTMLVECGAIRERVSQELARAVFDAVKRESSVERSGRMSAIADRSPLGLRRRRAR